MFEILLPNMDPTKAYYQARIGARYVKCDPRYEPGPPVRGEVDLLVHNPPGGARSLIKYIVTWTPTVI